MDLNLCLERVTQNTSYHGLLVGLTNKVTNNITVSVVLWCLPFNCHIEAPHVRNLKVFRGSWQICPKHKCNLLIKMTVLMSNLNTQFFVEIIKFDTLPPQ